MEDTVRDAFDVVIPFVEGLGGLVVVAGAVHAFVLFVLAQLRGIDATFDLVRLRLARYLALGLEFQLGADILSTAISPSFEEIGKLGAIATIRTLLQYFLGREMAASAREGASASS